MGRRGGEGRWGGGGGEESNERSEIERVARGREK